MALNKAALENDLKSMFASRPKDDAEAAKKMANIIYNFVVSATVTTTVTGTCATPAGAGTVAGTGTGSLS